MSRMEAEDSILIAYPDQVYLDRAHARPIGARSQELGGFGYAVLLALQVFVDFLHTRS